MKKHWYNCWLFHSWYPWGPVQIGGQKFPWQDSYSPWEYQKRRCSVCNMEQTRDVN